MLVELKLRPPLDVGECMDALPEEAPRRSGYTSTTRSEPELTVNVALLWSMSSALFIGVIVAQGGVIAAITHSGALSASSWESREALTAWVTRSW